MTIDILYVCECPNFPPAVESVRQALQEEHASATINEIPVEEEEMATALGFLGSPTIRVNGVDVEPSARAARSFGICCRTYVSGGSRRGAPSIDLIRQAIRQAGKDGTHEADCCA